MKFFERFNADESKMEPGNQEAFGSDYSLDDSRKKLNRKLKTREIITGEDVLEPNEKELEAIKKVSELRMQDAETIKNNIRLLMTEIDANNRKIKQLEESIRTTEQMEAVGDRRVISTSRYKEMIKSLEKLNDEKESAIKKEEQDIVNLYNQN